MIVLIPTATLTSYHKFSSFYNTNLLFYISGIQTFHWAKIKVLVEQHFFWRL